MNKILITAIVAIVFLTSCSRDRSKPNIQYMPDMYETIPYEPYGINESMQDGMAAQTPPDGAIARGKIPFEYAEGLEGYDLAKVSLHSPLAKSSTNVANGKKLFNIYCAICHGEKGDGQGNLVKRQKFFGVPHFKDRDINEGSIYHVIYYGRNMMGSHASQMSEKERWQVVQYVQKLKRKY
jgi:mono/diheme cytochrome c family protein